MYMKTKQRRFAAALGLLTAFLLWTAALRFVDVQPIGPGGSRVGFATLNQFVHALTGVHIRLYHITDWLGLVPVAVGFGFALLGLCQWIRRKHLGKVDFALLALGVFYLLTLGAYQFFEEFPVNYRPVLIDGYLEASYPSSTTLLVLCVMPTALLQCRRRIPNPGWKQALSAAIAAFVLFMVIARLLSGVHWFSDIVGGGLLSSGLVLLYRAATERKRKVKG